MELSQKQLTGIQKIFLFQVPINIQKDWKTKLESAYSFILKYSKITVWADLKVSLMSFPEQYSNKIVCISFQVRKTIYYKMAHQMIDQDFKIYYIHLALEFLQDFLIKLDMKPCMHLVEISIFLLNLVIVRLTKLMKNQETNKVP